MKIKVVPAIVLLFIISLFTSGCGGQPLTNTINRLISDPKPLVQNVDTNLGTAVSKIDSSSKGIVQDANQIDTKTKNDPSVKQNTDDIRKLTAIIDAQTAQMKTMQTQLEQAIPAIDDLKNQVIQLQAEKQQQADQAKKDQIAAVDAAKKPLNDQIKVLTVSNQKLTKASQLELNDLFWWVGGLVLAGIISVAAGVFCFLALKNSLLFYGLSGAGAILITLGLAVISESFLLALIGSGIVVLGIIGLIIKVLLDQKKQADQTKESASELIQTVQEIKPLLLKASPSDYNKIFGDPNVKSAASIQSPSTVALVAAVKNQLNDKASEAAT